jgi:hypothetical protein
VSEMGKLGLALGKEGKLTEGRRPPEDRLSPEGGGGAHKRVKHRCKRSGAFHRKDGEWGVWRGVGGGKRS